MRKSENDRYNGQPFSLDALMLSDEDLANDRASRGRGGFRAGGGAVEGKVVGERIQEP